MTIYEINAGILECLDEETGEILDEQKLNELQLELDAKIENVACWYKEVIAEAEAVKAEKLKLAQRQKVLENKAESLKKWLAYACEGKKHSYARAVVSFRSTKVVDITDIDALIQYNPELVTYGEPKPIKDEIKALIEAGEAVDGAVIRLNNSCSIK